MNDNPEIINDSFLAGFDGMDEPTTVTEETTETVDETVEETTTEEVEEFDEVDEEEVDEDTPGDETETEEAESNEPFLSIRFNHEDRALTREEAITMAQKGMNYDNLNNKYIQLNGEIEKLAQMNGMNVTDYLKSLNDMQMNFAINKEIQALKKQFPDTNEELLKEIARTRVNDAQKNKASNEENVRAQEAEKKKQEIARQIDKFQKRYPNVDPRKLNDRVLGLMQEGYTMLEAYDTWRDEESKAQAQEKTKQEAVKKANAANKKKSLGNVGNTGKVEMNAFLSGFDI